MPSLTKIKINHKFNTYLLDCDLLNKYSIKNINQAPKLKKIILELPLEELIKASESSTGSEVNDDTQIQSFLILYLLSAFIPYIVFKKSKRLKDSLKKFSVKFVLSEKSDINNFLVTFFVENWFKLKVQDFILFKNRIHNVNSCFITDSKFTFNTKVPINSFIEIENFLNQSNMGLNSKELFLNINFLIHNPLPYKIENSTFFVKNLPLFWIGDHQS